MRIYMEENLFDTVMVDFKLAPHRQHWQWMINSERCTIVFRGVPSWSNLKQWMRAWWEKRTPHLMGSPEPGFDHAGKVAVCREMFSVVEALQSVPIPWIVVEGVLEAAKRALEAKDRNFAWA